MPINNSEEPILLARLSAKGERLTNQRRAIIQVIEKSEQHLDAASLLQRARTIDPSVNRATVYRTLDLLKKHRLIDELDLMHLSGEKHFYEAKPERDHIHLACFECGAIEEYTSALFDALKAELLSQTGFHSRVVRMEVGGRCRRCCTRTCDARQCSEDPCCKGVSER